MTAGQLPYADRETTVNAVGLYHGDPIYTFEDVSRLWLEPMLACSLRPVDNSTPCKLKETVRKPNQRLRSALLSPKGKLYIDGGAVSSLPILQEAATIHADGTVGFACGTIIYGPKDSRQRNHIAQ